MVFSSLPPYLDPSNWQQQPNNNHHLIGSSGANHLLQAATPPPPSGGGGGSAGSIRPGSMSERARMAQIPMPETALKCPRCESTNTKFCYFNNYSLSQPRHFCKTCRRYWTRGGALRSVPVGGGCRRNKRSKSKSSPASSERQTTSTSTSTTNSGGGGGNMLGLTQQPMRFTSPLGQLTDSYSGGDMSHLNYSGPPPAGTGEMSFQSNLFSGGGNMMASLLSSGIEPWRLQQQQQQFPFIGGLDHPLPPGMYPFQGSEAGFLGSERPKLSGSLLSQLASVKMEENGADRNLSRQIQGGNEQWNSTMNWTHLSGFSSSSTTNPL